MTVQIRGSMALPALKLRRMVALSPVWQELIADVPRPPEAPDAVYLKNALGCTPRPFCVVSPGQGHNYTLIAGGDQNYLRPDGSLFLYLTVDTPQEFFNDQVEAEFYAASVFGAVMDDVAAIANADDEESEDGTGHLAMIGAQLVLFGETEEEFWQSVGRFYFATYSITWGDGGGG